MRAYKDMTAVTLRSLHRAQHLEQQRIQWRPKGISTASEVYGWVRAGSAAGVLRDTSFHMNTSVYPLRIAHGGTAYKNVTHPAGCSTCDVRRECGLTSKTSQPCSGGSLVEWETQVKTRKTLLAKAKGGGRSKE
jgi:hypothetical protein